MLETRHVTSSGTMGRSLGRAIAAAGILITGLIGTCLGTDKITLREGTELILRLSSDLSSRTAEEGDPVAFKLAEDLKVQNVIVLRSGTRAYGEVSHARKSRSIGRGGELSIRLKYIRLGDTEVHIRGVRSREGDGRLAATLTLAALFGPLGLIKHGNDVDVREGTLMKAFVAEDVLLEAAQ